MDKENVMFLMAIIDRKWKLVQTLLQGDINIGPVIHKALLVTSRVIPKGKREEGILLNLVEYLLDAGAFPNYRDHKGRTCIMLALRSRLPKVIIQTLLQCGADPYMCDYNGHNVSDYIKPKYWFVYGPCFKPYILPTCQIHENERAISQGIQYCSKRKGALSTGVKTSNKEEKTVPPGVHAYDKQETAISEVQTYNKEENQTSSNTFVDRSIFNTVKHVRRNTLPVCAIQQFPHLQCRKRVSSYPMCRAQSLKPILEEKDNFKKEIQIIENIILKRELLNNENINSSRCLPQISPK